MIRCALLDLDDTLCNYWLARQQAKKRISHVLDGYGLDIQSFWEDYGRTEKSLMRDFQQGKISREAYRSGRFTEPILLHLGDKAYAVADELNRIYMEEGNEKIQLFDDALPFIQWLKQKGLAVALITNGPSDGQRTKIASLGLDQYMDYVYISEEVGCAKPDKGIFEKALEDLGIQPQEAMMIGNSYDHDYLGAVSAGIPATLVDRFRFHAEKDCLKVSSLLEAQSYILKQIS